MVIYDLSTKKKGTGVPFLIVLIRLECVTQTHCIGHIADAGIAGSR